MLKSTSSWVSSGATKRGAPISRPAQNWTMPTSAINLRIDADLKTRVSTAAESAGLTLTEYVIQALTHLTAETYNPWAAHPYNPHRSPRRTVVRGDDIFDRDRDLLKRTRVHCSDSPGPDPVVVRLIVPKGLNIGHARLTESRAWQDLRSDYIKAITHPRLELDDCTSTMPTRFPLTR